MVECASARCRFELPEGLSLPNLVGLAADAGVSAPLSGSSLARAFENNVDASLTWSFVGWLRSVTRLPLFVKARPPALQPEDPYKRGLEVRLGHLARACTLLCSAASTAWILSKSCALASMRYPEVKAWAEDACLSSIDDKSRSPSPVSGRVCWRPWMQSRHFGPAWMASL